MIMQGKSPSKPENDQLGKNPKVADKVKSLPLIDEAALLSSLVNSIEGAESLAKITEELFLSVPSTFAKDFINDDQLINRWRVSVKIDPRLKTKRRGSIKIVGYMDYHDGDLEILKKKSKS